MGTKVWCERSFCPEGWDRDTDGFLEDRFPAIQRLSRRCGGFSQLGSSRRDKLEKRPRSLPAEGLVQTRVPSQTVTLKGKKGRGGWI